jgi:hypothetical protein
MRARAAALLLLAACGGPAGAGFAEMTVARPGALPSAVTRDAEYCLILVFDGEVVRRHSLVRRGP